MSKERDYGLTEKQQENKKEDKKAFKKFILALLLSFVVGNVIGAGSVVLRNIIVTESAKEAIVELLGGLAVYGAYVFTTVLLIVSVVLYKKSRAEYNAWDEEDEDALSSIDTKLSYVCWFSNLMIYGSYFFFSAGIWAVDVVKAKASGEINSTGFTVSTFVVFLHIVYALAAACIVQQKAVNLLKEINPEKTGSVYDMKFQDKWLVTCDEAERYTAYKCSFKTFKTMQIVGVVLWVVCLVGQMLFNTGAFATMIITIFMIIQTSVYSVQGIYFAKHPSEVMK